MSTMRRFTKAELTLINDLDLRGVRTTVIAATLRCSRQAINYQLRKLREDELSFPEPGPALAKFAKKHGVRSETIARLAISILSREPTLLANLLEGALNDARKRATLKRLRISAELARKRSIRAEREASLSLRDEL